MASQLYVRLPSAHNTHDVKVCYRAVKISTKNVKKGYDVQTVAFGTWNLALFH
jgi:hypothetical protein